MSYALALGPFGTAWRGPQRLVLRVDGERVVDVVYRGGYNERGCAERLARLDLEQSLHLVSRICGGCSHHHTLAFCQCIELLGGIEVGRRAMALRTATAELERLVSHLGALGDIFEALGMRRVVAALATARAGARAALRLLGGGTSLPYLYMPGGLRRGVSDGDRREAITGLARLNRALFTLTDQLIDQRPLLARTVEVGAIGREAAAQFGLRGPMARACGLAVDARLDQPYALYGQLAVRLNVQEGGDVYARLVILLLEALESIKLAEQALADLPEGSADGRLPRNLPAGEAESAVESPHGLLRYRLESDGRRIIGATIDPPRQIDRLLARTLLTGALLDNVALIVVSVDPCLACAEL